MFAYGFEVEPMEPTKSKDPSAGMSFGVHHHRHDDGSQSWGYAIGSGPLPSSALQESAPSAGSTGFVSRSASPSQSGSEPPVLTVRPSGPSAPATSPGLFQAAGGTRPIYARRDQPPAAQNSEDGFLLLGSQNFHQVVPFDGDFGARLSRRLRPDESASQWRGQAHRGGFQQRQEVRFQQPEQQQQQQQVSPSQQQQQQQQQQPSLYPSTEQPEAEVQPSEQQDEPPVTTYRPSDRPSLATASLEEPVSAPSADFAQGVLSSPIHVTQVVAAAQPVSDFRNADGSRALPGPDPRFRVDPFAGPLPPGVFPPGVGGVLPFNFNQQGPPFGGNFPTGPAPGFNGFPSNGFVGPQNAGPQNGQFFGNNFPSNTGPSFPDRSNAQLIGSNNNILPTDQFQSTERYPEDNFNQFSDSEHVSNAPSSAVSPLPQDGFTDVPSGANDVASTDHDSSSSPPENERRRYRDGDTDGFTNAHTTSKPPRIRKVGRRISRRRQRPTSDPSPLLSASDTPDSTDEKVFADPDSSSDGARRRPSKAILTAASIYQDDTTAPPKSNRVTVGQFVDPLNGTRIVIRRRLKKIPRDSTDDTTQPSATSESGGTDTSTTVAPHHSAIVDDKTNPDNEKLTTAHPTYKPDRHRGPRPRVLAVGRRRNRLQPRRKSTSTTETPVTAAVLDDIHPVEAPPTRRYRQRSRQRSRQRDDDALSSQGTEGDEQLIATGEESEVDAVLARPPTDRASLLEQRKAARRANRLRPSNSRRRPSSRNSDDSGEDPYLTEDEQESDRIGGQRRNRPGPRFRGRPQRGPGIVRPDRRTTPVSETGLETTTTPQFAVTTPSGVSADDEVSLSTVAVAPTEEPARQRGASRLRRPGRPHGPGGRRWRTQQDDDTEDRAGPTTAPSLPSLPSTLSTPAYLPTTASGADYSTSIAQGYLPTTAAGVISGPSTSQTSGYLPTTESGLEYTPSTAQGPSYLPSTEPGLTTVPTTIKPRSLMDRYKEDRLTIAQAREERLRAQFDHNQAARGEGYIEEDSNDEDFRSLFNRRLDEKLSASIDELPLNSTRAQTSGDDQELSDAASRAARIQALFAQYTKATRPPSSPTTTTTTTTTDPPFLTSTTLDPNSREAKLQALFAQYTKGTTPADPTSAAGVVDLNRLFALHSQSIGTTVPTPVVVESFKSSVSRVGAAPSGTTRTDQEDELYQTRGGYLPQPTTASPFVDSTVADVPPRASTEQPDLARSQAPSPIGSSVSPASTLRPPSDSDEGRYEDQWQQQETTRPQETTTTTRRQPTTHVPVTEPTTSRTDPTQWPVDNVLKNVQPTAQFDGPNVPGNEVNFLDVPPTTTRRPSRRPTLRPEPARTFDGFNGIEDERHAEKLTLDSSGEQETGARPSGPELQLPVRSGAQSVAVSLAAVLLSSWLSLTMLKLML